MTRPVTLSLLFVAAFAAGLIDALAGGGGMITIPALLATGMPPQAALATNKLQASFGSGSAMLHFLRSGTVGLKECRRGIIWTFTGAASGVAAVQMLDPALLKALIPWLLAAIALYMAASPRFGHEDSTPRLQQTVFYPLFGLVIGFYDGFLGPGTGSFWAMAFMVFLGYSLLKATAFTKVMNFTSNISALMIFLAAGQDNVKYFSLF